MLNATDIAPETTRPLRRCEYEKMVALGLFEDERLELLEGVLVTMSPQGSRHAAVVRKLNRWLTLALEQRALVQVQSPLALADDSEPEPDVAVIPIADYDAKHPNTAFLIVEVADASLSKDRQVKSRLYAEAEIAEYWLVNLLDEVVEIFRSPQNGKYAIQETRRRGERLAMSMFNDVTVAVDEILPG